MKLSSSPIAKKFTNPIMWLAILLVLGAALRLFDLTDEPLELHPTRQFRALIIARGFYYPDAEGISSEQTEFAEQQAGLVGLIEPSILEFLIAQLYKIAGQELTWVGRLIPITAWLLGGLALFALSRNIGSNLAAVLGLAYYLFLPFGTKFSRVLMADPIMVAGTAASLWALYAWSQRRDYQSAVLAGSITGLTILLKSVAGIILIVPFALFLLASFSIKDLVKDRQVWLVLLLAALPTALYYYHGLVIDGRLETQFKGRFFPEIWTDIVFYKSWGLRIIREFNILAFTAGLLGILLARSKQIRLLLLGWWAGYFIYAMLFAYHTWTHDYYHLPMVPLIAVSLAPVFAYLEEIARQKDQVRLIKFMAACICLVVVGSGSCSTIQFLSTVDHRETRAELEQLGAELNQLPQGKIIGLTNDYETSFSFYNYLKAEHWPSIGDMNFRDLQGGANQSFEQLWQITEGASYFFITDFKELEKQPLLAARLSAYPVIARGTTYSLYELDGVPP
jgi:hypothetical protein